MLHGPFVRIGGRVLRHLMRHRKEYRLKRQVVPDAVERRRPHEHATAADLPLEQRNVAVVEPRELLVAGRRRDAAIAEEPRRREITAPRRAEQLEDRMASVDVAERAAAIGAAVDRRVRGGRQQLGCVRRPVARRRHGHRTRRAVRHRSGRIRRADDRARRPARSESLNRISERPTRSDAADGAKPLRRHTEVRLVTDSERTLDVEAPRRAALAADRLRVRTTPGRARSRSRTRCRAGSASSAAAGRHRASSRPGAARPRSPRSRRRSRRGSPASSRRLDR